MHLYLRLALTGVILFAPVSNSDCAIAADKPSTPGAAQPAVKPKTPSTAVPSSSPTALPAKIKYRPRSVGAPAVRVTGGSRGTGPGAVTLDVLAPDEVGLTTLAQPSLFWFQSKPADARFELTLLQDNEVKPLLQISVERSTTAGIQRINLADHGVKLTPGVEYQWVVALTTDAENRSSDLVASGVIKRIEPPAALAAQLASGRSSPALYAEAGIWYDALAALSDQIEAHPKDRQLRQARADLLRDVGLKAAADYEAGH